MSEHPDSGDQGQVRSDALIRHIKRSLTVQALFLMAYVCLVAVLIMNMVDHTRSKATELVDRSDTIDAKLMRLTASQAQINAKLDILLQRSPSPRP